jgi:hypothetical protein
MGYRNSDNSGAKAVTALITLVLMAIFYLWFYSADASGSGVVTSKWHESHTSCDSDGDCTTHHSYLIQMRDGRIFKMFWGTRDWDRIPEHSHISFTARDRRIDIFGWRLMVPDIFNFEMLEPPPG